MKNNDINDEDYGKEMKEPKVPMETPWGVHVVSVVIAACVASVIIALTLRLDKWLVR